MTYSAAQTKEAYEMLSQDARDFITSNEVMDVIAEALGELDLNEDQKDQADSEIFHAMLGLQGLDDAIVSIASLTGKSVEALASFRANIGKNVFDKNEEIVSVPALKPKDSVVVITKETKREAMQNLAQRVANARQGSNQAVSQFLPKNLPMVEEGEKAHEVPPMKSEERLAAPVAAPETKIENGVTEAPAPTAVTEAEKPLASEKPPITPIESGPRYPGGIDPYREPLV
jgi:hypothetical protein